MPPSRRHRVVLAVAAACLIPPACAIVYRGYLPHVLLTAVLLLACFTECDDPDPLGDPHAAVLTFAFLAALFL